MWLCRALATTFLAGTLAGSATASPPLSIERLAGQSIMTGMSGRLPDAALLSRIRAGEVGGVILFSFNLGTPSALTATIAELQAVAAAGGNPPLLIAIDQEGGPVRRLSAGPPDLSAAAMGRLGSAAKAGSEGDATGAYLKGLGINVDLAPVLDTTTRASGWLGDRTFSGNPHVTATLGARFLAGVQRGGGVAATAKHFPGLGTAPLSTDTHHVLISTSKATLDAELLPFERAIAAGVKLVMVSNAGYSAYDGSNVPAVLSRPIVDGLLREKLGFDGVVISDAMEAPGPSSRPAAPVTAIAAGVDVLLYTSETDSDVAYARIVAAVKDHTLPIGDLEASAARIEALKSSL
jgi:beta-N-acetylhexosaminidase